MRRSLATRLTLGYVGAFLVASLLLLAVLDLATARLLSVQAERTMEATAQKYADLVTRRKVRVLIEDFEREARHEGTWRHCLRILPAQGADTVTSDLSGWPVPGPWMEIPERLTPGLPVFRTTPGGAGVPGIRSVFILHASGTIIHVARSMALEEAARREYRWIFFASVVCLMGVGTILGHRMLRHALRTVDELRGAAVAIGEGADLTRRVDPSGADDELGALAGAFNAMLDRIQSLMNELRDVTHSVAHDLRTPVTRMRAAAEQCLSSSASATPVEELAGNVVAECDRLAGLLDILLELARLESGQGVLVLSEVDVNALSEEAVELFLPSAEDKGVQLRLAMKGTCPPIQADRRQLQRVVANLLDNAIKYTPAGGEVAVETAVTSGGVVIRVRDTGIGISESELPRVFERFHRCDPSRGTPGHGLGLALARALVREHGGDISVQSQVGKGSVFTVRLPLGTMP